jgi:hypothetical protein
MKSVTRDTKPKQDEHDGSSSRYLVISNKQIKQTGELELGCGHLLIGRLCAFPSVGRFP